MTQKLLRESVAEAPVKQGNRWRVIVAKPGKGSSGTYSEELFRRDAAKIIAPGGQAYINHDDKRNPKDMIGHYPDGARWSEEDKAVVAELEVFSHWSQFVEEVGPHCGMSLYALGDQDEDGNVIEIIEDVYNGADLVSRPGLVGSGLAEKLYEAARSASDKPSVENASAQERKDNTNMEIKDLAEKVDSLAVAVEALASAKKAEEDKAAQVVADENAVTEALEAYDERIKAIDEADLLPSQVESLRAEAKAGKDVAPLIESAKKVKADFEKDYEERLNESGTAGRIKGVTEKKSATELGKVFG